MFNKVIISFLCLLLFIVIGGGQESAADAASSSYYVQNYQDNYPEYLKHDRVIADAFLDGYNNSEAHALLARGIWYMENGYMIYGHSKYWDTGYIDCSNFVSLVYKDLGYKVTSASKSYNQVGEKVAGVYSRKIKGSSKYELVGIENLRPGDIFTFWKDDSDGSGTHIGHVALYLGEIDGKPAIIHTNSDRPTAIGIRTDFRYWYGEHFSGARRVLDNASQYPGKEWQASSPVIPAQYQLSPQKPVIMPESKFMSYNNNDISGHWAAESINQLFRTKSLSGYPDGTFRPDNTISRAEFATILVKEFNLNSVKGKVFEDTSSHWASDYITAAAEHGIVKGYNDTLFGPDDPITREQMVVMLVKAAHIDTFNSADLANIFTDSSQISDWAKDAVFAANKSGILSGYPNGNFRPQGQASRAEAANVIVKAVNK